MTNILTIVPTRGRPQNAAALIDLWEATAKSHLLLAIDNDDPCFQDYVALRPSPNVMMVNAERMRMNGTLNFWAESYAGFYDVIGFIGDDHRPRGDWEYKLTAAFEADDDLKMVYGDDLAWGEGLPTACWQSAEIIRRLGYFSPPKQTHLYLDNYWLALGNATKRVYLPDMIIEHVHPAFGKTEWDAGYTEVNDQTMYDADKHAFDEYMLHDFESEMAKLR